MRTGKIPVATPSPPEQDEAREPLDPWPALRRVRDALFLDDTLNKERYEQLPDIPTRLGAIVGVVEGLRYLAMSRGEPEEEG